MHVLGIIADSMMFCQVKIRNKTFKLAALIAVGVYSILFFAWLIYIFVVRFNSSGKVCSGNYLPSGSTQIKGYAIL